MRLNRVTITGADESVSPYDLCVLYDKFPFVEWGILLSESREGKEPRYPSRKWIDNLFERTSTSLRFSGHLCGQWSRDAISGPFLWAIQRHDQFERFNRIQFNGADWSDGESLGRVKRYVASLPCKDFIMQVRGFPADVAVGSPSLLLDNSGGRGVGMTTFPEPAMGVYCGYSGGLGPGNLEWALGAIAGLPLNRTKAFWVDMESNVRSDIGGRSVFDLAKVRRCLEIAAPFATKPD